MSEGVTNGTAATHLPVWDPAPRVVVAGLRNRVVEIARTGRLIQDEKAGVVQVIVTCPTGAEVPEAFLYVNQDASRASSRLQPICDAVAGRYRKIRASLAPMTSHVALRTARVIRARRSSILLYHGVGPTSTRIDPGFLRVRPKAFREQLGLLLEAGFETVTVSEFVRRSGGRKPPPGLVALSFDDGMDDNHSVVLPLLREHGVRATVYVTTGLIGKPNPWMAPESGARMMTVDELRELAEAGFEIGAHTVTHPDLSRLGFDECLREMRESRDELERTLRVEVRTFAYPSCHYGHAAVEAVRAAGFTAAVTCQGLGSWKRYELRRSLVSGKDGTASFLTKLTGRYEPLSTSPPGRLARATTRRARTIKRARAERREWPRDAE